jgi:hypothetical protein
LQGHWERVNTPLRTTARIEIWAMTAVAAIVLVGLAIALFAAIHDGSSKAESGCIEVPATHAVGGATIKACGADAVRWCREAETRDDWLGNAVGPRCRRAGYP